MIEITTFFQAIRLSYSGHQRKEGMIMTASPKDEITRLYDEHSRSIIHFIILMVKDYSSAEDLTHDTFVKAYTKWDSFNHQASERTWLFSIAHNVTMDYIRKRKPALFMKEFFQRQHDSAPLPDEFVITEETSSELHLAIGSLKDSYRKVIILRKIKQFSIEETSEILGWSESKVKSTLHRAMPALRKQIEKEGYWDEEII